MIKSRPFLPYCTSDYQLYVDYYCYVLLIIFLVYLSNTRITNNTISNKPYHKNYFTINTNLK